VNSGGRDAVEALLAAPEPLVDRLWRHEVDATPLTTPEQRAGLKQRLIDHAAAIGDRSLSQLYRDEWMERFFALTRRDRGAAPSPGAPFTPQRRGTWVKGKGFVPPEKPLEDATLAIGRDSVGPHEARAIAAGLAAFPDLLIEEAELLGALPFADPVAEALKRKLLDAALSGRPLDSQGLLPILSEARTAKLLSEVQRGTGVVFSFNRNETDPARGRADLKAVIELLGARREIAIALALATRRVAEGDEAAVAEQHRLAQANQETIKRLADFSNPD
jgi:DNA primase